MNSLFYREIRPEGWLRRQLEIQAKGLSGHLDKIWPDVRDSAWIGGDREGWERVPYWLDGFIPLAHLLQDDDLIVRADRYVPKSAWNYGFSGKTLTAEERPVVAVPFSSVNPPLVIKAELAPVAWEWADGFGTVPAVTPINNIQLDAAQEMALVPYGCAKLRMTELPRLNK